MNKDQLFLLKPSFLDGAAGPGLFHCPSCARIEGVLSFFPALRDALAITYLDFPRPRTPLVDLIGPEFQSCPTLVLAEQSDAEYVQKSPVTGRWFVKGADNISRYMADRYGISTAHP